MQSGTATTEEVESFRSAWGAGVAGGFAGGVGMGILLHGGANLMPFVGALYGWPTVVGGWLAHLVNSVLLGVLFAVLLSRSFFREQASSVTGCVVAGVLYAAGVALVTSGVMLPLTMNLLGTSSFPDSGLPLPGVVGGVLVVTSVGVAHVVYGVVLGATYGVVRNSSGVARPVGH